MGLLDFLDQKIPGTAAPGDVLHPDRDPVAEEAAQTETRRAANTENLRSQDAAEQKSYEIPRGQYLPPEDTSPSPEAEKSAGFFDKLFGTIPEETDRSYLLRHGTPEAVVNDPYNMRGGQPRTENFNKTLSTQDYGPPMPTKEQFDAMKEPAEAHAEPSVNSLPPAHARGGSGGRQPSGPAPEAGAIDAPIDLSDHPVTKALVSSGVRPEVAAMLADAARRRGELADAQKKSELNTLLSTDKAVGLAAFTRTPEGILKGIQDQGQQPTRDILAQQEAEDKALPHAKSFQEFSQSAEAADPNSAANVGFRDFYKKLGFNLPAAATIAQFKDLGKVALEHNEKLLEEKGRGTREEMKEKAATERNEATNRTHIRVAEIAADAKRASEKDQISDRVNVQLQGGQEMIEAARDLDALADKVGVGAALEKGNTANDSYLKAVEKASQAESKAIHGNATEQGAAQFRKTYPDPRLTSADAIRAQAADLRRRGQERVEGINKQLQAQRKAPIPEPSVQPGREPITKVAPRKQYKVGDTVRRNGTLYAKGEDGLWHPVRER